MKEWYNTHIVRTIGKGLAVAVAAVGIGYGCNLMGYPTTKFNAEVEKARLEATTKIEYQRLRTIEEIVRAQGNKITLEDLQMLLIKNNLSERKK